MTTYTGIYGNGAAKTAEARSAAFLTCLARPNFGEAHASVPQWFRRPYTHVNGYAMMTIIQSASQLEHLQSAGDVERTDHCSEFCGDVLLHRLPAGRTERSVDVVDIT